ncbi:MAG TPA: signal recognition particle protein, partial [Gaiellales bacterium]|nr:signal recognition particle protein [Gaiellales bacterium]
MFDSLSDRLGATLDGLKGKGRLSEDDINKAMREIRLALLEADVNFGVVKDFVARVRERAMGSEVMDSLTPGQQVVKIVHEELTSLMGEAGTKLSFSNRPPTVILMAGLQGSGKTTACGKLARNLAKQKRSPALVACDVYRPAAIQQLQTLGKSLQVPVYERGTADPVEIAAWGVEQAKAQGRDVVIVDTAGRLHIDDQLMDELVRIKKAVKPHNVLLVLDSMSGQDAVTTAEAFSEAVDYDGVILTKLDGDARGGAALAVRAVTGKPIKFVSVGEKLDQLEEFHPDRMASRILGMGDVMSLIERAQDQFDEDEAREMEAKLRKADFTLEDFLGQLRQVRKMTQGQGMAGLLGMIPGVGRQVK